MRIQVGCCLCADTRTQSVNRIMGNHGIDRANVHLVGLIVRSRLDKVLDERLQSEDNILESLDLLQIVDKLVHGTLALGQLHPSVLVPEGLVAHHHVGIPLHLGLALEQLLGQFVKAIVAHSRRSYDKSLA